MRWIFLLAVLLLSVALTACSKEAQLCVDLCNDARNHGMNLTNGPCLGNPLGNSDWVCDVAHNPRQMVDNLPENQCSAFRNGTAHHFIEVDENCKVIRVV